ncbi:hypothetical protein SS50377_27411 [Spironucleus salmonicida]|uniref:Uncharacterized protein n=1 Tax=Spironucleus salmonicida TaxID=348837 RepID=V6LR94_9EUKA|nr:hypothetical protein SS50377_27411 [Spironucleus salmonicida]|eukprot:EST43299.1 Hypothetical protein SS50377_16966 [Spironucleus salmonicida]
MSDFAYEKFTQNLHKRLQTFSLDLANYHKAMDQLAKIGPKLQNSLSELLQAETSNVARIAQLALKQQLVINDSHIATQRALLPAYALLTSNQQTFKALNQAIRAYKMSLKQSENSKTAPQKQDNEAALAACSRELISRAGAFEKMRFDAWKSIIKEIGDIEIKRGSKGCESAPVLFGVGIICCEYGDLVGKLNGVVGDVKSLLQNSGVGSLVCSRNYDVEKQSDVKMSIIREDGWE